MNKTLSVLGIIPARAGSKCIPQKNIKKLNGKPLIYYTIKSAQKSKYINRIIVSTEDSKIAKISEQLGVEVIKRPKNLARDDSKSISVCKHIIDFLETHENYFPDLIVFLQPTSPFRTSKDIDMAYKKFIKLKRSSLVSLRPVTHLPYWIYILNKNHTLKNIIKTPVHVHRRQEGNHFFEINGAIYINTRKNIFKNNSLIGKDVVGYIMPIIRSLDIDSILDFKLAELILKNNLLK